MIINVILKNDKIVGYRTYPIKEGEEYIEIESIPNDLLTGNYTVQNHKLIVNTSQSNDVSAKKIEPKAYDKQDLLNAFEKYKSDVVYGIVVESEDVHNTVLNWYRNLKNDVKDSCINPPIDILKYMED